MDRGSHDWSPWFWRSFYFCTYIYMGVSLNGSTQQPWVFPTRNDHFGVFWGYHHLRKPPYYILSIYTKKGHIICHKSTISFTYCHKRIHIYISIIKIGLEMATVCDCSFWTIFLASIHAKTSQVLELPQVVDLSPWCADDIDVPGDRCLGMSKHLSHYPIIQ